LLDKGMILKDPAINVGKNNFITNIRKFNKYKSIQNCRYPFIRRVLKVTHAESRNMHEHEFVESRIVQE
jgi:hypothetical protein